MSDPEIKAVLDYCHVDGPPATRRDSYVHWERCLACIRENSGMAQPRMMIRLRAWVGVDFRYLQNYLDSFVEYGVISVNSVITYIGIPDGKPLELKTRGVEPDDPRPKK
jgi:hypothetical protein